MSDFTTTAADRFRLLVLILMGCLLPMAGHAESVNSSSTKRIELIDATSVLSNYSYAATPKERLPFVYLGNVSQRDFFTCYGSATQKFAPTRIAYIKQIGTHTFRVTWIHPQQNKLSRADYKLMYQGNLLLIDWETSLKDKFQKRMDQIARQKNQYWEKLIHSVIDDIVTLLGIGVAFAVFLLPTIIGLRKRHVKTIYAVNFLLLAFLFVPSLGIPLAIITWMGCLIWAVLNRPCLKRKTIMELQ